MSYAFPNAPAVVSRPLEGPRQPDRFLVLGAEGALRWTEDPCAATTFESMREAMRACARLPSALRAFGLPLRGVIGASALN